MQDISNEIAFIGIGKMGLPMSLLIAKAGYSVTAYDQSAARLAHVRAQGISVASSAAEAVNNRFVVATSLPDDAALHAVLLGSNGLLAAMAPKPLFAAFTRAQTYLGPAEEARYAKHRGQSDDCSLGGYDGGKPGAGAQGRHSLARHLEGTR
jgi:3-hydroxyisobutyrate dehydrogenase-like beta-hydroxyacid dehydrogenase